MPCRVLGGLAASRTWPRRHPSPLASLEISDGQHGLKQCDLSEIGSQGVVSEILTGKRDINIRQVRALSERFRVSAATFV